MTPEEHPKEAAEQTTSRGAPRSPRKKHRPSLLGYLIVLFFAAFLLLLLSYFMQQRRNDQAVISGLQESISAMQSVDVLRNQNQDLNQQLDELKKQVDALEQELDQAWDAHAAVSDELTGVKEQLQSQTEQTEQLEKTNQALDWLWRIEREYFLGRYTSARTLVHSFKETGLEEYLPNTPLVDSEYRTPLEQYQAMCRQLGIT